jgi:acyl-CoA hydrolase
MIKSKSPDESYTVLERTVLPADINSYNTLYGGKLMEWIDNIAGIVAAKHSRRMSVTGSIDGLFFLSPIRMGDIVKMEARVNYVTKSTMEIEVDVMSQEAMTGVNKFATKAVLTYIAVGKGGHPANVPALKLNSKTEKTRFKEGAVRSKLRLKMLKVVRDEAIRFNM